MTMPMIEAVILYRIYINKGKINTSIFFPILHHEESLEKLNIIWQPPLSRYLPPTFLAK